MSSQGTLRVTIAVTALCAWFLGVTEPASGSVDYEVVSGIVPSGAQSPGSDVTVSVSVRNNGSQCGSLVSLALLFTSCTGDRWYSSGGGTFIDPFCPSSTRNVPMQRTVPQMPAGTYDVFAFVDYGGFDSETNELNNCKRIGSLTIPPGPCTNPPRPVVVDATITWAQSWQKMRYLVRVRNDGGMAVSGSITFEVPALYGGEPSGAYQALSFKSLTVGAAPFQRLPGEQIYDDSCQPKTAQYMIMEAEWQNWGPGETRMLEIQVDRSALNAAYPDYGPPSSGGNFGGPLDCMCGLRGIVSCSDTNNGTPCQTDSFLIGYRTTMECDSSTPCDWYDPGSHLNEFYPYSPPCSGGWPYIGQQGWSLKLCDLAINDKYFSVPVEIQSWSTLKGMY